MQDNTQATNGWLFLLDPGTAVQYRMFTDDTAGIWNHHYWSIDRAGDVLLYTNGILHPDAWDISAKFGAAINPNSKMDVGRREQAGGLNWLGNLDNFKLLKGTKGSAAKALEEFNAGAENHGYTDR